MIKILRWNLNKIISSSADDNINCAAARVHPRTPYESTAAIEDISCTHAYSNIYIVNKTVSSLLKTS